ncbi:MAG TPA: alpha/beta fold hydrolase [Thermomicrobiales bacterium]|nr:alpha/beta fold hydrolase [Thermomicrobiales bacterium]
MGTIQRDDHRIEGRDGMTLAVRRVWALGATSAATPLILVHGARAGGVASFDVPVEGGSLAADLAGAGYDVFVMDARGYGGSSRPPEMEQPATASAPLVRSVDVVRDLDAVVDWVRAVTGEERVSLLGWATGGHWAGFYASLHPDQVKQLIIFNTLYGSTFDHPSLGRGSGMEDAANPGRFDRAGTGGWRSSAAASLLRTWDNSIPEGELDRWRDPAVAAAYARAAIEAATGDPDATAFPHPTGALEDSFYLATGRQLWDASFVRAHTLVIRSERDFWSRPEDVERLAEQLIDAASVRTVTLLNATHFAHLDRPEYGRRQFLDEVLSFLAETA